ncbi:MAG: glyoxalase [Psychroflexus sp.]|nr:glyoxalase [Psychroflexus sp.]
MINRNLALQELRPEIPNAKVMNNTGDEERFQNQTLRPIAKFQNDLMIAVFKKYIQRRKNVFYSLSLPKKEAYIDHSIKKDLKFRNQIKGIFIGLFTDDEYAEYIENSSKLNKRIANLAIERLKSNIQLFEKND